MKSCEELRKLSRGTATFQDNLDMISNPQCWPGYVLALINVVKEEIGVIIPEHIISGKITVKKANIFMLPKTFEEYEKLPGEEFTTIKEMLISGWKVD